MKNAIAELQAHIRAGAGDTGIRWEIPDKFHFTLKFLGETPEEHLPRLQQAAERAAQDSAPFELTLAGIGAFPRQRSPQVLWAGAKEGVPLLTRLAECLDRYLSEQEFPPERRRFHPHITLARARSPEGEEALARILLNRVETVDKIGVVRVESFLLMRSELRPAGSIYTVLKTFPLAHSPA